jgi:hypothetical protein
VPSRRIALAACVVAASVALAGCSGVDAALSKQWAVVNFHTDTQVSTLIQVRAACSHVPNVRPLPASESGASAAGDVNATYSVRYEVSHASAANLEALRTCVERFSSVAGIAIQDVANQG